MTMVSVIWWPKADGRTWKGKTKGLLRVPGVTSNSARTFPVTDLIFTPIPGANALIDASLVTQFGGYGPKLKLPGL